MFGVKCRNKLESSFSMFVEHKTPFTPIADKSSHLIISIEGLVSFNTLLLSAFIRKERVPKPDVEFIVQ